MTIRLYDPSGTKIVHEIDGKLVDSLNMPIGTGYYTLHYDGQIYDGDVHGKFTRRPLREIVFIDRRT